MFILAEQRDTDPFGSFDRYARYLKENAEHFPPSAYALATSSWYFDASSHQCPHDSWLEAMTITEPSEGQRNEKRRNAMTIRLLGSYHDGHIELHYPVVHNYMLDAAHLEQGHRDWRYDELRIDENGRLVHEIEWWGPKGTARWVIVASDIKYLWIPGK